VREYWKVIPGWVLLGLATQGWVGEWWLGNGGGGVTGVEGWCGDAGPLGEGDEG
jgi:hypothetical protein